MLTGVLSSDLDGMWGRVTPLIEKALKESQNDFTIDDIYEAIWKRDMQLWVWKEEGEIIAALVTEIVSYPSKRVCTLILGAGVGIEFWRDDKTVFNWAKEQGCAEAEIRGRRGWGRALKDWKETSTNFRRDL